MTTSALAAWLTFGRFFLALLLALGFICYLLLDALFAAVAFGDGA